MKFEDLPSYEKVGVLYEKFYHGKHNDSICIIRVQLENDKDEYFSCKSLRAAYTFLKENPEFEICDNFFGNNFPFLRGELLSINGDLTLGFTLQITNLKLTHAHHNTLDACGSEISDYDYNFSDSRIKDLYVFLSSINLENKYVVRVYSYLFVVSSYDEFINRIDIAEVMES